MDVMKRALKFYNSGVGKPVLCIKVWKPQKVDQFTYQKNKFVFATYGTFSIIKSKMKKTLQHGKNNNNNKKLEQKEEPTIERGILRKASSKNTKI